MLRTLTAPRLCEVDCGPAAWVMRLWPPSSPRPFDTVRINASQTVCTRRDSPGKLSVRGLTLPTPSRPGSDQESTPLGHGGRSKEGIMATNLIPPLFYKKTVDSSSNVSFSSLITRRRCVLVDFTAASNNPPQCEHEVPQSEQINVDNPRYKVNRFNASRNASLESSDITFK
ncbi:hypothetical protein EVAR_8828_1 [Eumeta japonica]|uniref:Uncharacterized protein n=1 Tax=Eumeta variegata TaxID=151549 RepID=A0A4C1TU04_EUMVA|nr:hypothetical protein EVAR_8828_1 [Eumeta japonica]